MLNDPEIDKLIIYGLVGVCAVLLLAVLILAFKRNVYYVNDKGQEVPKPKRRDNKSAAATEEAPVEAPEEPTPTPEVAPVAAPVVEPIDLPETGPQLIEDPTPTTVVPVIKDVPSAPVEEPLSEEPKAETLEVPAVSKAVTPIKGALVLLQVNGKSEERAIDHLPCLMGRESNSCDFVILESAVSRRHARILVADGELCVEDVSEHNGTFVNGNKLPPLGRMIIQEGDTISLGRATITIQKLLY